MSRAFFLSVILFFSVANQGFAQVKVYPAITPASSPEAVGFSSERLKRIDTMLQGYVDRQRVNGMVGLLIRDGKIVYHKSLGYDDIDAKTPMKKDAIFRIASQTKAITSVAAMILYEEGKFNLDDPISNYIPEFKNPKVLDKFNMEDTTWTTVPARREITFRDLMTHTSGIGYAQIGSPTANVIYHKLGVFLEIGSGKLLLADQMKKLATAPLLHQPGERFTYGLNSDLLGYLIEVISGMSLDQFFRTRIFEPLGMKDTYFYLPKEKQNRLVTLYSEDPTTKKVVKTPPVTKIAADNFYSDYPNSDGTMYSGGGGLSSTIMDYAIFLQMMLNGGEYNGKRILSPSTVRMMTTDQVSAFDRGTNNFGLGFGLVSEKASALAPWNAGSYNWGGMFATTYWVDPEAKLVALIYRNVYPTSLDRIVDQFRIMTYSAMTR
jgi:Beta-lactamase class C and other penicillin binding proteins